MCIYIYYTVTHTTFMEKDSAYYMWQLLEQHGVVYRRKPEFLNEWNKHTLAEQRIIYQTIKEKINNGQFVNFYPDAAIRENVPKQKQQTLTYNEYYKQFGTDLERDGWKKVFIPEKRCTIYVKGR